MAASTDPVVSQRVYDSLTHGSKTRYQLAAELDIKANTVKNILYRLGSAGLVRVAGKVSTGARGRPALVYASVTPPPGPRIEVEP